jgi:hypothetical protein
MRLRQRHLGPPRMPVGAQGECVAPQRSIERALRLHRSSRAAFLHDLYARFIVAVEKLIRDLLGIGMRP